MNLKPLDVILISGRMDHPDEAAIMIWSGSIFTHSVVAKDSEGNIFNPTIGGILNDHISSYDDRYRTVRRLKKYIPPENVKRILDWCYEKQATSKGYDYAAWLGFLTGVEAFEDEDRWYCSEVPYWMFQENGYRLTWRGKKLVYPSFFNKSRKFQPVLWQDI